MSAVQAICGDWEGCACELRERLRQACCYRRCHRPEQGIALFYFFLNLFLIFFLLVLVMFEGCNACGLGLYGVEVVFGALEWIKYLLTMLFRFHVGVQFNILTRHCSHSISV